MKNKIVKDYYGDGRAGTFLIAKGFERDHFKLMRLIEKYKERFLKLDNKRLSKSLIIQKVPAKKAGRPIEEYLLNEAQTIFLGTLFRNSSDIILDFKMNLAKEFVNLKKQNEALKSHKEKPEYLPTRNMSKIIRRGTTDEIEKFIEYAKKQGGSERGCEMYYSNITRMMNAMLFIVEGKHKNLRDVMSVGQLMTTYSAEKIVSKAITDNMAKNIFYKKIYDDVKNKVKIFAELHGQSAVIEDCLKIDGNQDQGRLPGV